MRRLFKRAFLIWLAVVLVTVAGRVAWRLGAGWKFVFAVPAHGEILGTENGVTVHAYGWNGSFRGKFGLEFECVELINRYYTQVLEHRNMSRTGHAESYFWGADEKGLVAYPNGGTTAPAIHDILVFDGGLQDGSIGHVAVVVKVNEAEGSITFIQQNSVAFTDWVLRRDIWKDNLPLRHLGDEWIVDQGSYTDPIAGWSRLAAPARSVP